MADAQKPGSPLWWVDKLERELNARQTAFKRYDDYYEGDHQLGFATPKFRESFGALFAEFADNWCDLVVDAVEERLNVEGFRYGQDKAGDSKAWRIWQSNHLDADSQIAHTEALIHGQAYVSVWAGKDERVPSITVEHPAQVVVAYAAGNPRVRLAALKRWVDDDGYVVATLYLPDAIYKYRSSAKLNSGQAIMATYNAKRWKPRDVANEAFPLLNPLGVVPIVPLANRPRLLKEGVSEIHKVIPVQDGVNKLVTDMLVASEFGAAPQRWATGIEVPKDPTTGLPLPVFENLINRLWSTKSESANFGQFPQTDLRVFVTGIEMLVQHIASQTRTPPHYFYLSGQFPSGESIKSAETGLVAKSRRKMRHFGESWEESMRLAFLVLGDKRRSQVFDSEVIWGDPESRSESEHIDAVVKRKALGIPDSQLWEDAGYSPQQIQRFVEMGAQSPNGPQDIPTPGATPDE